MSKYTKQYLIRGKQMLQLFVSRFSVRMASGGNVSSIFYHQVSLIHRHFLQYIHYVDKQTKFPLIVKIMLHIVMNNVVYNQQIGINDENTDLFRNCR